MAKKILLVDDSRLTRELTRDVLEKAGYKVIMASDGKEGLDVVNSQEVDLVILDLVMPVIDGWGFLNVVKSQPKTKYLPIIVLTTRDSEQEIEKAKKSGAFDCLIKYRVKPAELVKTIKSIISL